MQQIMKMEVAPWIKDYTVDVDKVYGELILDSEEKTPIGTKDAELNSYQKLFEKETSEDGQKILILADPGYGKTSLSKKIIFDWAKGIYKNFTMVLLVSLKQLQAGDLIENVIIQQTPGLEGRGVSPRKLQRILETFGERCLIILDGLDEHALGSNEDVMKIITGEKLSQCSIVATSRPHIIADVKRYFPTVVRTRGFTQEAAEEFALKILEDAEQVKTAMNLTATPLIHQDSPYVCPLLLSFKCILVRDEDIGFTKKTMFLGDIYAKMIRCLYKAFTLRKGIPYQATDFFDMLLKIGKLAFETLVSGNYDLDRREIIREVGGDALNYGLIIGHEIDRVAPAGTGDIHVTFLDEGIQYFLGAFQFMQMLTNGESIGEVLHSSRGNTVIRDPLFLHFSLWMLKKSEGHFSFSNTGHAYELLQSLVTY